MVSRMLLALGYSSALDPSGVGGHNLRTFLRLAPAPVSWIPGYSGLGEGTVSSLSSQSARSFKYRCLVLSLC